MKVNCFAVGALTLALLAPSIAQSKVFYSVKELLLGQFKQSEKVTYVRVRPSAEQKLKLQRRLGKKLARSEYVFNVAKTGERVDGYALFDKELGQHLPIDIATFFDSRGKVTRVEVVAYREAYGDGVRAERFRRQFVGKSASSSFRVGKDVDGVSGATISAQSMARAVKRAATILDETVLEQN